ncbi:MAG TPA: hypothetical protein VJ851_04600 [Jatrophihabitans sp.]|nr:hypothetical protein [Jatrophihabitans sp.]
MGHDDAADQIEAPPAQHPIEALAEQIRQLAYQAWLRGRTDKQDNTITFFDRIYLGHYSSLQHYAASVLERYQLDQLLAPVHRPFIEFDIEGLARYLLDHDEIYTIDAAPVGIWVFDARLD